MNLNRTPSNSHATPRRRLVLRVLAWASAVSGAMLVLAAIVLAVLLNSQRFHQYLLANLEGRASSSLGVRVKLENFALHLPTLSVDLYGLTVDGAAPYQSPALLQVQHAQAGVRIVSLFRRQWYLDNFRIEHPVMQIIVDSRGVSNLPTFKSSSDNKTSTTDAIFNLGVRHAILDHGELYYNDQPSQLSADLHDLEFHAAFSQLLQQYSGSLAYNNGRLVYGAYQPLVHNLSAEFKATRTTFNLTRAKVSTGASQINLAASLTNYQSPVLQGNYDITVDGSQLAKTLNSPSLPAGQLRTVGSIEYKQSAGRSLLDSLLLAGDLNSRALNLHTSAASGQVSNLAGHYELANGEATLRDLTANLLGGSISAAGAVGITGANPHSKLNATLHGIQLADLHRALGRNAAALKLAVAGTLNASASATWGKTFDDLDAHSDATIEGQIAGNHQAQPPGQAAPSTIPINSAIHATYTAKTNQLALNNSYLRTAQTNLDLSGTVSRGSALNVRLQANDLREVETIADLFRTAAPNQPLEPLGLAGTASFQGTVRGSTTAPHIAGQLSVSNLQIHGSEWKTIHAGIDANPSQAGVQHADLEPASGGRISLDATAALHQWSLSDASNVQLNLQAAQLNIADFERLIGQQLPVTGTLSANASLHGTELNPVGNGNLQITKAAAYGQSIQSVRLNFTASGDQVQGDLTAQISAGFIDLKATVHPQQKTYTAHLTSAGIDLAKLEALTDRNVNATGHVSISADGEGSFDNPQLNATLQIPTLTIQNQTVQNQTISAIVLQANLANHVANATLASKAVNTSIQAKARIDLTGDYQTDASIDTQQIPLAPLLVAYAPDEAADVSGQTEVHAALHGPLRNRKQLEAHVTIPTLKLAYSSTVQLEAAAPIQLDYNNGVINLQRAAIRGTDTDLQFQGSIPVEANAPMSLMLAGSINLQLAQLFDPDIRSSGELKLNINSSGAVGGADFGGQIEIVDANIASASAPVGLTHANGVLNVSRDRISIAKFEGTVGGGPITAQGAIAYRPKLQFDLGASAQGVRLLYPQGVRERVNADVRLSGSADNAVLGGTVNLSDVSFTPGFDLNTFVDQFSGGVETPPTRGFSQNVQLNLAVHSTSDVNLVSRTLSVDGSANLQVRGTAANPVILGRVNLSSGDIILNGNRFVLNGGTVQFVNPAETQPVVNLAVGTTIQQYNITLRFEGPASQLRTQYSSDPALPQADIINLLAFGETTEASAQNSASTTTTQAAQSLVASQVSSQVTSRVSKIAGISQLSVSPVLAQSSTAGPPGANITIQQRVTGNLFVTFSTNVASTQSQTIQGQYQVSPRVAVSATRDPNGGFAVDTLIKKTW